MSMGARSADASTRRAYEMGGLSLSHLLIVLVIALIVFGAGRVSEVGKGLGEGIRNFKKGLREDDDDEGRLAVKRKPVDGNDDAPRLLSPKKKLIQVEVDDDEDEAEVLRRLGKEKKKPPADSDTPA
jgi:sec-independent protein translocase protein TatA